MSHKTSSASSNASRCALLALPAELRDHIYHLVFWPPTVDHEVDLFNPNPPNKALLLACQQIYSEAREIYRTGYRQFWTHSRFVLDYSSPAGPNHETIREAILHLDTDIEHINTLRVMLIKDFACVLVHKRGGWRVMLAGEPSHYIRLRVWTWRPNAWTESVIVTNRLAWDAHGNDENSLLEACERYPMRWSLANQIVLLPASIY